MKYLKEVNNSLQGMIKSDRWDIRRYNRNNHNSTVSIYFNDYFITEYDITKKEVKSGFKGLKEKVLKKLTYAIQLYPSRIGIRITCKLKK